MEMSDQESAMWRQLVRCGAADRWGVTSFKGIRRRKMATTFRFLNNTISEKMEEFVKIENDIV